MRHTINGRKHYGEQDSNRSGRGDGYTVGSTLGASAMHGGMGHGGMSHGGMGHMGMGHMGMGHSGFGRPGFSHRVAFHHDHFRHRFFRNQFVFAAAPYGYYDDDCYIRVRTRWGWRLRSVCY